MVTVYMEVNRKSIVMYYNDIKSITIVQCNETMEKTLEHIKAKLFKISKELMIYIDTCSYGELIYDHLMSNGFNVNRLKRP